MFTIRLNSVRCFAETPPIPIRRLTFLIGENSTGKSSFLALLRIARNLVHGDLSPNFNVEPFFLGAYDQIAHYRGGRGGRARSFAIEVATEFHDRGSRNASRATRRPIQATFSSEFVKRASQPSLSSLSFTAAEYEVHIHLRDKQGVEIHIKTPSGKYEYNPGHEVFKEVFPFFPYNRRFLRYILYAFVESRTNVPGRENKSKLNKGELNILMNLLERAAGPIDLKPHPIAPVRTKPERTYNPVEGLQNSEGAHVPMVLAKTFFTDKEKWKNLQTSLDKFGKASGLFSDISLKTLGKSGSDPFQIYVKITGPAENLIDVGYGVSQVLPVLVDLLGSDENTLFLLQQPEVHLHPRAQAELGSFFANFVKQSRHFLVVETHSDYLLDRIRISVKNGILTPEDVSILFFDRPGRDVTIYPLSLDRLGNIKKPPETYRDFFLREEEKILGF